MQFDDLGRPGCLAALKGVALSLLLLWTPAQAQDELETVGLAVYTETARDIYIAGLKLPYGSVTDNIMLQPPPKAMEYRIATRRLSGRGFSGTILLQSELGSGGRAPDAAINALADLKASMRGSLKQGDRFIIYLNEDDETVFLLNGTELLRVQEGDVFDFFYSGWVGDGTAPTFREPLLAGTLDPAVNDRFNALTPSPARIDAIAAWSAPAPEPAAPQPAVQSAPVQVAAATAAVATTPAPAQEAPATTETASADAEPEPEPQPEPEAVAKAPAPKPKPAPAKEPVQEPVQEPVKEPVQVAVADTPAPATAALDDREYQQQLREYVSQVMRQVYGEVKYPRRAIKYQWEGRVELIAKVEASGDLIEVTVDSTSGHVGLDKAAQSAVERAAPFPELNAVAQEEFVSDEGDGYVMAIPVTFALRQ